MLFHKMNFIIVISLIIATSLFFLYFTTNNNRIVATTSLTQKIIPNNIPNRFDIGLLLERENFLSAIEVGVQNGEYADRLLSRWNSCSIYVMIDPWLKQRYYDDWANVNNSQQNIKFNNAMNVVNKYSSRVEFIILRTTSDKSLPFLKGRLYDFIYLDARHDYISVKNDLSRYYPLLKHGGIIAGHDFLDSPKLSGNEWLLDANGKKNSDYKATKSAVDDFAFENKLNVTTTAERYKSWMIRKPN